ncbi:MAG: hypothetical protein ABIJ57_01295 [Pseudomonadota bacterium]
MMVSEAEAKRKWCPVSPGSGKCMGSMCMAWRQVGKDEGYCGMAALPVAESKPAASKKK